MVPFARADVRDFRPPDGTPGTLVCNPPYGERIGDEDELRDLYETLGEVFRRLPGWRTWVFTGNERLAARVGLPMAEQVPLFNGRIPCRLVRYENE
jgi:23S rRNA (guanine2445-N2)-methyltransferase